MPRSLSCAALRSGPRRVLAWAVFTALLPIAASLPAQTVTATVNTGMVVDVALTGSAVQDLDFGRMAPGSTKSVAFQDAQTCTDACTAGKWIFKSLSARAADRNANVRFALLPDSLVGPGGAKLGVTYTSRACVYLQIFPFSLGCVTQGATSQGTTIVVPINNVAGAIGQTNPQIARDLYLWLGGTASPRPGQRAGNYSGVVTVFFFYN